VTDADAATVEVGALARDGEFALGVQVQ